MGNPLQSSKFAFFKTFSLHAYNAEEQPFKRLLAPIHHFSLASAATTSMFLLSSR